MRVYIFRVAYSDSTIIHNHICVEKNFACFNSAYPDRWLLWSRASRMDLRGATDRVLRWSIYCRISCWPNVQDRSIVLSDGVYPDRWLLWSRASRMDCAGATDRMLRWSIYRRHIQTKKNSITWLHRSHLYIEQSA